MGVTKDKGRWWVLQPEVKALPIKGKLKNGGLPVLMKDLRRKRRCWFLEIDKERRKSWINAIVTVMRLTEDGNGWSTRSWTILE